MTLTTIDDAIADFTKRRSKPLPTGSGASAPAEFFKAKGHDANKSAAKRWDDHFSFECSHSSDATLKAAAKLLTPGRAISLGVARPSAGFYPWDSMMLNEKPNEATTTMYCTKGEAAYDLGHALNYSSARGSPQLIRFLTEHVELLHDPPYSDWDCSLTCGTTSAVEIVLRLLCDRGDCIFAESYSYPGTMEAARHLGVSIIGIDMDEQGLIPDDLESKLRSWDTEKSPRPSMLYTIPSGQNPTSTTQPTERRRAIYDIAEQYNLLIIEDDPYYLLQLGYDKAISSNGATPATPADQFLKQMPASYLSMDRSGRVIRLDTFAKILAPGLRCGWITACSQIIDKFVKHQTFSVLAPSGPSQVMLFKLLDETWGHKGFVDWLMNLSSKYRHRRDIMSSACERFLPADLCHWSLPTIGMFLWIQVDCSKHPQFAAGGASRLDIEEKIFESARLSGVLLVKGSWFTTKEDPKPYASFRITFVAADSEDDLPKGIELFGKALRIEFGMA